MKLFPFILCLILVYSCENDENKVIDLRKGEEVVEQSKREKPSENEKERVGQKESVSEGKSEWTYKVIFISENNWGYQLFQNEKMMINQTSIPSIQGINGFDSEEKADRTAKYILSKLEKGIFPPTVNKEELENLDVLRD